MPEEELILRGRNDTAAAFREVEASFGRLRQGASDISASFRLLAGVAGIGVLVSQFKGIVDQADNFNKLAQRTGIATEALSELSAAAQLSDVSQEGLSDALRKLAVNMADAAGGGKEAAASFKAIGVEIRDSSGNLRDTDSVLQDVAARFATFADGPAKAALAVRLFGRSGADLIPLLNSMSSLREEGRRFAAVYGTDFARSAEQFNDNFTRLSQAAERFKVEIVGGVLPGLTRLTNELVEGARIAGGFGEALRLLGTINPFRSVGGNLRELRAELESLERDRRLRQADFSFTGDLDARIADTQKRIEFLKFQQREAALAGARGLGDVRDARDLRLSGPALGAAPVVEEADKATRKVSEFEQALKALRGELARTTDDGNKFTEVFNRIGAGEFGRLTEGQRAQVLQVAAQIETEKQLAAAKREVQEATKGIVDAEERRVGELLRLRQEVLDKADPGAVFEREQQALAALQRSRFAVDPEIADARNEALSLQILQARGQVSQFNDSLKQSSEIAREFGLVMTSAISSSIREWKGFGDLVKNVGIDIAQVITKTAVLNPIQSGIEGFLKSSGGFSGALSGIGSFFGNLFKRADGGSVAWGTPYLVGERGPELFIPGQSGAIVPNGAGMGGNVTVNVALTAPGVYDSRGLAAQIAGPLRQVVAGVVNRQYLTAGRNSGMALV